jgi:hypothetical protein
MFNWICQHKLGILLTLVIIAELAMFLMNNRWMPWNG